VCESEWLVNTLVVWAFDKWDDDQDQDRGHATAIETATAKEPAIVTGIKTKKNGDAAEVEAGTGNVAEETAGMKVAKGAETTSPQRLLAMSKWARLLKPPL